jgi:hypothetical protein
MNTPTPTVSVPQATQELLRKATRKGLMTDDGAAVRFNETRSARTQ